MSVGEVVRGVRSDTGVQELSGGGACAPPCLSLPRLDFDVHRGPTAASWLASASASVPHFVLTVATRQSPSQVLLVEKSVPVFLVHACPLLWPHVLCSNWVPDFCVLDSDVALLR